MSRNGNDIVIAQTSINAVSRARITHAADHALTTDGSVSFQYQPIPDDLLDPPGVVGDICRWINSTAIYYQPVLVLGNVLTLWGTITGRKVASPTDLRTNVYIIGVALSGAGKDNSRKKTKNLIATAGLGEAILGGEDLASDAAILRSLRRRPSQLMQIDELGKLFGAWNSPNAATYLAMVPSMLMKVFSSASTLFVGREYATEGRPRIDIYQPNLCLYGTSVPDNLYGNLRREQVEDGLLGRFLVFETNDHDPRRRKVEAVPPPAHIAPLMRRWLERDDLPPPPPLAYEPGDLETFDLPTFSPIVVPISEDAEMIFDAFDAMCSAIRDQLRGRDGLDALWARAYEHAVKLALVIASGCGFTANELQITAEHASYATRLVELTTSNTCARVLQHVAENVYEKFIKRILLSIQKAGPTGKHKTDITIGFQALPGFQLDEILNRLVDTGQITKKTVLSGPQGGRPATIYTAVEVRPSLPPRT